MLFKKEKASVADGNSAVTTIKFKEKKYLFGKAKEEKIVYGLVFAFFVIWSFVLLYPVFWVLVNSFKTADEYYRDIMPVTGNPFAFPSVWRFENYIEAFKNISLRTATGYATVLDMIFNTLWYCVLRVVMGVFIPMATAYAMAKYKFFGRQFVYTFVIISLIIPIFGTGGAAFTFYYDIGIYDSPLFVVFTGLGGFGGSFLIMYGYFKSISWEYAEAVFIDGGGNWTVFLKIMIPMAMPIGFTFAVLSFIGAWNDYGTMLVYLPDYPTLASAVYNLSQGNDSLAQVNPPAYFALLIIMTITVLAVFIAFSNVIMSNLTVGGIKG